MTEAPTEPRLHHLAEQLGDIEALDPPARVIAKQVRQVVPRGPVKDALSGTWLGHALHPALIVLPIGTWMSASLLDLVGGRDARPASRRLIAAGIAAAVPTAMSGTNDWVDTEASSASVRRVGAVHAIANVAALTLYSASLAARRRGRHGAGVALGLAGVGALAAGGQLGGHLSYSKGVGINQTAFDEVPGEWTDVVAADALADGEPHFATVDGTGVLLVREGGEVRALDDRCCHRGAPLHEGQIEDGCVVCPRHGSKFRLRDGSVERGPAAVPQPVLDVRLHDGRVAVRAPSTG
jgi:nitrite reductase/ring-hydroxylating ferredoxin subunit/uncharacterized membrane protein